MTRGWTATGARSNVLSAALIAVLISCLTAYAARAESGIVTTRDGQTFEGEIKEESAHYVVTTKGNIPVRIQKANVESVELAGSAKEQFEKRMAKLKPNDSAGRVALAEWAVGKQEYDLAMDALDAAIAIDPNNEEARRMSRDVLARRRMARQAAAAAATPAPAPVAAAPADAGTEPVPAAARQRAAAAPADDAKDDRPKGRPIRLVTTREINRIRQLEMRPGEPVRINFQNQVKQRYLASADDPQAFNKMTTAEQAAEILKYGSSRMRPDVIIATDPMTLTQFKQNVQRHLLLSCATASCHGPANKDVGFTLHNPAGKDTEAYTNFLLLQEYRSTSEGKDRAMIDRQNPDQSLLLSMGLPLRDSPTPHPEVQNFKPAFKGKNDRNYQAILAWMENALDPVAPEYEIDLSKPPADEDATTRPTKR